MKIHTLEKGYFHVQNGGFTFSIKHTTPKLEKDLNEIYASYYLSVETSHMGVISESRIPLDSPEILKYITYLMKKTAAHRKKYKVVTPYTFTETDEEDTKAIVEITDGKKVKGKKTVYFSV